MLKVKDIMTKNVISCSADTSVKEVARLMTLNNISGLPVLNSDDKLTGIITEADLVKKHEQLHIPTVLGVLGSALYLDNPLNGDEVERQLKEILAVKVEDLMSPDPISVTADASVEELAEIFLHKKANPVPVVENGRMIGIVSRADVVKFISGGMEKNLPVK